MKTSAIRHTKISLPYNLSETPAICFRVWCTHLNKPGTAWPDSFYSVIAPDDNIWSQTIPWHEDDRWQCFANIIIIDVRMTYVLFQQLQMSEHLPLQWVWSTVNQLRQLTQTLNWYIPTSFSSQEDCFLSKVTSHFAFLNWEIQETIFF